MSRNLTPLVRFLTRGWVPGALVLAGVLVAAGAQGAPAEDILGGKLEKQVKTDAATKAEIARLQKQVAADPKNYRLHFQLANACQDAGDEEKARSEYEEALRLNPKYLEAMVNLGSLYSDLGQPDEAVVHFEKALGIDPKNCKARSNLGNAYYALERYPDAMFEYRRAMELDPKCYSAMYNIAVAFADAGLFREAVQWWGRVEKVAPGTEAARSARENMDLLERFVAPPGRGGKAAKTGKP